jgi:hypothetical protein
VRERTAAWEPFFSLAALDLALRPSLDLEAIRSASDFLGELLRAADGLTREECFDAWAALLEDSRFNKFRLLPLLDGIDWQDVGLQAQYLCADLLSPGTSSEN